MKGKAAGGMKNACDSMGGGQPVGGGGFVVPDHYAPASDACEARLRLAMAGANASAGPGRQPAGGTCTPRTGWSRAANLWRTAKSQP